MRKKKNKKKYVIKFYNVNKICRQCRLDPMWITDPNISIMQGIKQTKHPYYIKDTEFIQK